MSAAALPEADKGYQTLTSSNPMVGLPPPSPFTALCQTASAMPHLADVRRSDQSVQEESIRIKQDELPDAMTAPFESTSVGDVPRRSSHSPEDTAPAPQDGTPDGLERNGATPQATMARLQSDPDLAEAAMPIKIITTLAEEEKAAAKASDKAPADGDGPKDDENVSPSRRSIKPSEADEAAALALQAIFVAPPDISRTHSPLQILTAEVEKEKEEEEERAATDTPLADGETLPRAFEVCFDSVAGTLSQ